MGLNKVATNAIIFVVGFVCINMFSSCNSQSNLDAKNRKEKQDGDDKIGAHADDNGDAKGGGDSLEGDDKTTIDHGDTPVDENPLDTVVDVPSTGPYGTRLFTVHAATNWVNTGLFLKKGETAKMAAAGQWTIFGEKVDAGGVATAGMERGCSLGSFVARSGLSYQDEISCIGKSGVFTAKRDDVVYVGMIASTDLGEFYGDRLKLSGAMDVTITSVGDTVPTVKARDAATFDYTVVKSGRVEILGRHIIISISAQSAARDRATAAAAIETLDKIYEIEKKLRSLAPFNGQRIRFYDDDAVGKFGLMIAGNPIRCMPEIMSGKDNQRILRAGKEATDIWGFAHELGHNFSLANGSWTYQQLNMESWPNVFTLRALTSLGRTAHQPNAANYCDGKDAYLKNGRYTTLKTDPFLQLCFLMEFQKSYGWTFWEDFFVGMNSQSNVDVLIDDRDKDRSVWSYIRDRFNLAAGADVTHLFNTWRVPVTN